MNYAYSTRKFRVAETTRFAAREQVVVQYTLAERRDVKFSHADVLEKVALLLRDKGYCLPVFSATSDADKVKCFTTVQLNEKVESHLRLYHAA